MTANYLDPHRAKVLELAAPCTLNMGQIAEKAGNKCTRYIVRRILKEAKIEYTWKHIRAARTNYRNEKIIELALADPFATTRELGAKVGITAAGVHYRLVAANLTKQTRIAAYLKKYSKADLIQIILLIQGKRDVTLEAATDAVGRKQRLKLDEVSEA